VGFVVNGFRLPRPLGKDVSRDSWIRTLVSSTPCNTYIVLRPSRAFSKPTLKTRAHPTQVQTNRVSGQQTQSTLRIGGRWQLVDLLCFHGKGALVPLLNQYSGGGGGGFRAAIISPGKVSVGKIFATLANPKACTASRTHCTAKPLDFARGKFRHLRHVANENCPQSYPSPEKRPHRPPLVMESTDMAHNCRTGRQIL
jgi:hypothetical protein